MTERHTTITELEWFLGLSAVPFPFDLQLFAAEDEGRTEEPTEYKKRKAREEGKVARTPELPGALVLLFGFFLLFIIFRSLYRNSVSMVEYYLNLVPAVVSSGENIMFIWKPVLPMLVRLSAPILGIQPDLERINPNPARFINKILFSRQALVNMLKSIFKIAVISVIAFFLVRMELRTIMSTVDMGIVRAMYLCFWIAFKLVMVISGILLVLSIPDYLFQRFEHIESLKMTKQELKEERRLLEGDPQLRARMREKQRDYARRRMLHEVPGADVVITNPVHYAVALKYEALMMGAPVCVAKGQDLVAERIKRIAEENDVALIENKPLARELYRRVDVGDEIPEDLFTAVAEVLAFVYRLKKKEAVIR
jgi:flagellar biosynthetic protein FlhB